MSLPSTKSVRDKIAATVRSTSDAAAGITPEQRAALDAWEAAGGGFNIGGSLEQSLGNLSAQDTDALRKNIESTAYAPGQLDAIKARDAKRAADAATNARFGNDMAWLDPEFQQNAYVLGDSERSKVYADPNLVSDQQKALDSLFGIAKDGGATAQERARRAKARGESENWLRGQREADMQNLAERGMSGSGAELLTLAKDRQDAATRNSAADLDTDAWLEQRALDATMRGGELAGQMRDTGFREGQTRAGAQDEFAKLNANTINSAEAANKNFKQNAYTNMINTRTNVDQANIDRGISIAGNLLGGDQAENQAGYGYSGALGTGDASTYNNAAGGYNSAITTPNTAKQGYQAQQDAYENKLTGDSGKVGEDFIRTVASMGGGGGGAGAAAGSFGGGSGGGANWGGIAQGLGSDDDDEKKAGSYA